MCVRLNLVPEPGKWYVSELPRVGRKSQAEINAQAKLNFGRDEMIVAGSFDSEAEAAAELPRLHDALCDTYGPW